MKKILFVLTLFLVLGFTSYAHAGTIEFLSHQATDSDATVYTFSTVGIGAADADRHIIADCHASNSSRVIHKITVGGVQLATSTAEFNYGIFIGNVTTGTTGDVVVTLDAGGTSLGCGLYRAVGLVSATAHDTDIGRGVLITDTPAGTMTIDVPANGFAVAACGQIGPGPGVTATWANVDENFDTEPQSGVNAHTGGFREYVVTQLGLAIVCTYSDTALQARMAASWELTATAVDTPQDMIIFE